MHSMMKVVRNSEEVTLISRHDGTALAWLLLVEIAVLGALNVLLAGVLSDVRSMWLPALASVALVAWTARQIRPDVRITLSLATGTGRLTRISPITGARKTAELDPGAIESLSLEQMMARPFGWKDSNDYVVAMVLRDGARHLLSTRGPLLAYQESVARFTAAAKLGNRVRRLPAS